MADETQTLVQSLVERAQAGDGGAFGELYEQFAPEVPEKKAEQTMDRSLDRHELTYALDRLTSDQRHVVTLRFLDGFTTAETAEIMGKTEDAVKKLQARGLVQLRRIIETARRAEDAPPVAAPPAPAQTPRRLSALGAA